MMPGEVGWAITVYWMAGDVACRLYKFGEIFGLFLSSNILICISLDRFYAIVSPLSSGRAANNMKVMLSTAWIISTLEALPQVSNGFESTIDIPEIYLVTLYSVQPQVVSGF